MALGLKFESVAEAFAGAAVDPSRWNAAMDTAAAATNSVGAVLLPIRGRLPNVPCSESIAPLMATYFSEGWVHRDERYRGVDVMMRRGTFTDLDFTDIDEIRGNSFYQELLAPYGMRWFGGVKIAFGDDLWCLAIQRSIEQGPFSSGETRRLAGLSEELASAGALARALGFARAEAALDAFEMSGSAVVLLDRHGDVIQLNDAAERSLGPDLQIIRGRLVSRERAATAELDRALHRLVWAASPSALMPPISLPRSEQASAACVSGAARRRITGCACRLPGARRVDRRRETLPAAGGSIALVFRPDQGRSEACITLRVGRCARDRRG